jgi:hypothetical protein
MGKGLDPLVNGLELPGLQGVHALASHAAHLDEADLLEHSQVLGNLRLRPAESPHQGVHGVLPAGKDIQHLPPPGLGNGVEGIECGKGTWHGMCYIPIWEYVKSGFR